MSRRSPSTRITMRLVAMALGALAIAAPHSAQATPTVWTRARDAGIDRRMALAADAESLLMKRDGLRHFGAHDADTTARALFYTKEARRLLEQAGADTLPDPMLRLDFASVLIELARDDTAPGSSPSSAAKERAATFARPLRILEGLARPGMSAYVRSKAWSALAQLYGRLDRVGDEIHAYTEALNIEPDAFARSLMLANRAEAYMLQGDLPTAIEGYRAALQALPPAQLTLYTFGVTTLWGLAVALDRSGELDDGLRSITLARTTDSRDQSIHDATSWTFVPAYDEAWYMALGHWAAARQADLVHADGARGESRATRAESYARAIASWEEYIARAPATDRWVALARVRLRMCEKERDAAAARNRQKPRAPEPARAAD